MSDTESASNGEDYRLFSGLKAWFGPSVELATRDSWLRHGGSIGLSNEEGVTLYISNENDDDTEFLSSQGFLIFTPAWVSDCLAEGVLLRKTRYLLPPAVYKPNMVSMFLSKRKRHDNIDNIQAGMGVSDEMQAENDVRNLFHSLKRQKTGQTLSQEELNNLMPPFVQNSAKSIGKLSKKKPADLQTFLPFPLVLRQIILERSTSADSGDESREETGEEEDELSEESEAKEANDAKEPQPEQQPERAPKQTENRSKRKASTRGKRGRRPKRARKNETNEVVSQILDKEEPSLLEQMSKSPNVRARVHKLVGKRTRTQAEAKLRRSSRIAASQ